ncbi:hypothetical protein I0P70_12425 [Pontibacter sp. FD36]|uniref:Cap15 family cyclic dinucleotide receptor domain-containing protein n=1 Tax=Pontibacter sp. FD36 TaxID=2789860 RepID=UPI0018A97D89|nr:hypothetical protein [Pontibacter sp. FD36]MBF8964053.1 hypothetical protein [Pontibacter sp. FD36]
MKNLNLKSFLYILLGISFIVFYLLFIFTDTAVFNLSTIVKILPRVVTINIILIFLFTTYVWKWKRLHPWLVPFPNLNGTWKGFIQSTWEDPATGRRPAPIPVILTIDQSFINISCVMRTAEMTSRSVSSDFILDKVNQVKRLCYTYDSNPIETVKQRSPQHCGTMLFDIIEVNDKKLVGGYWTGRKTTGHIEVEFWKDEKLDSYPSELGPHPVSSIRNNGS